MCPDAIRECRRCCEGVFSRRPDNALHIIRDSAGVEVHFFDTFYDVLRKTQEYSLLTLPLPFPLLLSFSPSLSSPPPPLPLPSPYLAVSQYGSTGLAVLTCGRVAVWPSCHATVLLFCRSVRPFGRPAGS